MRPASQTTVRGRGPAPAPLSVGPELAGLDGGAGARCRKMAAIVIAVAPQGPTCHCAKRCCDRACGPALRPGPRGRLPVDQAAGSAGTPPQMDSPEGGQGGGGKGGGPRSRNGRRYKGGLWAPSRNGQTRPPRCGSCRPKVLKAASIGRASGPAWDLGRRAGHSRLADRRRLLVLRNARHLVGGGRHSCCRGLSSIPLFRRPCTSRCIRLVKTR